MEGKAPAVKNSRSHFNQTIYRAQLGQKLPQNHENVISEGLSFQECFQFKFIQ